MEDRKIEVVDDFPKLVSLCAGGLADDPGSRSLRRLWNLLQDRTESEDRKFARLDLVPRGAWVLFYLAALGAVARLRRRRLRWLAIPLIAAVFFILLEREMRFANRFRQPLVVLREPTVLREGNSPLYPERLALPAGRCLIAAGESGGWRRVEYAPGQFAWIPQSAAIEVVPKYPF